VILFGSIIICIFGSESYRLLKSKKKKLRRYLSAILYIIQRGSGPVNIINKQTNINADRLSGRRDCTTTNVIVVGFRFEWLSICTRACPQNSYDVFSQRIARVCVRQSIIGCLTRHSPARMTTFGASGFASVRALRNCIIICVHN